MKAVDYVREFENSAGRLDSVRDSAVIDSAQSGPAVRLNKLDHITQEC